MSWFSPRMSRSEVRRRGLGIGGETYAERRMRELSEKEQKEMMGKPYEHKPPGLLMKSIGYVAAVAVVSAICVVAVPVGAIVGAIKYKLKDDGGSK